MIFSKIMTGANCRPDWTDRHERA